MSQSAAPADGAGSRPQFRLFVCEAAAVLRRAEPGPPSHPGTEVGGSSQAAAVGYQVQRLNSLFDETAREVDPFGIEPRQRRDPYLGPEPPVQCGHAEVRVLGKVGDGQRCCPSSRKAEDISRWPCWRPAPRGRDGRYTAPGPGPPRCRPTSGCHRRRQKGRAGGGRPAGTGGGSQCARRRCRRARRRCQWRTSCRGRTSPMKQRG